MHSANFFLINKEQSSIELESESVCTIHVWDCAEIFQSCHPWEDKYKVTFTRDRSGTIPNRTGPDRLLFTRDRSGTGPERIQNWTCCFAGPVSDPNRTGSRKVPCKHLDRFQTVPCKQKPIRSGSVRNGSGPVPCKRSLSVNLPSEKKPHFGKKKQKWIKIGWGPSQELGRRLWGPGQTDSIFPFVTVQRCLVRQLLVDTLLNDDW